MKNTSSNQFYFNRSESVAAMDEDGGPIFPMIYSHSDIGVASEVNAKSD